MTSIAKRALKDLDLDRLFPYGPNAYLRAWNVEVVGDVPPPPAVDVTEKDLFFSRPLDESFPLIYFPSRIRFKDGQEVDLTLNTLQEISGKSFYLFSGHAERRLGNRPLQPGWIRMSKDVVPDSRSKTYDIQKGMVEGKEGYRLPHTLEAAIFMQLVEAITGEKLYLDTHTRCIEKVDNYPMIVGGWGGDRGFVVQDHDHSGYNNCGAFAVRK